MTDFDLRFKSALNVTHPVDLTFNGSADAPDDNTTTLSATIDSPVLNVSVANVQLVVLSASIDAPSCIGVAAYDNAVYRGAGLVTASEWTPTNHVDAYKEDISQNPESLKVYTSHVMSEAAPVGTAIGIFLGESSPMKVGFDAKWNDADTLNASSTTGFKLLSASRSDRSAFWTPAVGVSKDSTIQHADLLRKPRVEKVGRWVLSKILQRSSFDKFSVARKTQISSVVKWGEAARPNYGRYVKPIVVTPGNGYTPPNGANVNLLLKGKATTTTDIIFGVTQYVPAKKVIPVKRTYTVINNADLRILETNERIETFSMDMSIDMESWTWGFNATVAKSELSKVTPTGPHQPVVVDALVNGEHFYFLVESISRSRAFGKEAVSVSGRGLSATLSDPYSPIQSFTNTQERTAQQLMNDVLSLNGVSLGWAVDWQIDDWNVSTGVWSHQGTYMSAITTIATSVGAFVQPDPVTKTLRIISRNRVKPWDLSTSEADIEIPSAVIVTESVKWEDRADYDSIYVSGTTSTGVLGLVRRIGSGGVNPAPMVTDPLMTNAIAARQRGIFELSKFGSIQNRELSLPVLSESGVILPGKIIKYTDAGISTTGVVKSVKVNVALPSVRQQISITSYD